MGAISKGFRESPCKGVAKVSGRTRPSREHDRSLRARPGLLSRFSGDRKHFSVRRLQQAREHFYGCAFARSVWPETAEHFPRLNAEADVRYGARRSIVLCQLPRLQHTNPAELEPKPAISFNENPRVTCSHSYRNATMGSTRIARMAGTKIAVMAINASNTATQTKLI